jgi:hypothetical protein
VIIIKVVGNRFGRFLAFKHGKVEGTLMFGEVDLQGIVRPEMVRQLSVDLPAKLVIARGGNNAQQVSAVKEILYKLILVQF